jgi:biopolymer transport protein ExbB
MLFVKKALAMVAVAVIGVSSAVFAQEEPQPSQEMSAAVAAAAETTALDQWGTYIRQGGKTMWFIALLSVLGIGCALERFWNLHRSRIVPDGFSVRVVASWKAGRYAEVREMCEKDGSMLSRVVETMLQHAESRDYAEVKLFAEDKAGRELRLENRKSAMLATAATIAPLLGLFGTVVGLLGAFGTVAAMGEMGDASVLADDIGKALVTTVAGLAVSMPCLFAYGVLKNRLALYSVLLEEEIADLVNQLFVKRS